MPVSCWGFWKPPPVPFSGPWRPLACGPSTLYRHCSRSSRLPSLVGSVAAPPPALGSQEPRFNSRHKPQQGVWARSSLETPGQVLLGSQKGWSQAAGQPCISEGHPREAHSYVHPLRVHSTCVECLLHANQSQPRTEEWCEKCGLQSAGGLAVLVSPDILVSSTPRWQLNLDATDSPARPLFLHACDRGDL